VGEAWAEDAMQQRKGVDEERAPVREDEERCGQFLFFYWCRACAVVEDAGMRLLLVTSYRNEWRRVKVSWDEFFCFLFNDEKSRASTGSSLACAVFFWEFI
jgi:hypothetical protein